MSNINKAGILPPIEIGLGRRRPPTPVASMPATKKETKPVAESKTEAVKATKKPASETAERLVFTPKPKDGKGVSVYLQKATLAKLDAMKDKHGFDNRSEVLQAVLDQVL